MHFHFEDGINRVSDIIHQCKKKDYEKIMRKRRYIERCCTQLQLYEAA